MSSMEKTARSPLPASGTSRPEVVHTSSALQTRRFGRELSRYLKPGDVLYLTGDLGSGKTTLVQGIVQGFGVRGFARSSSFVLVNEYRARSGMPVYHMDLYRLSGDETEELGLEEYLYGSGVCVVEWAGRLHLKPPPSTWEIEMTWEGEHERRIGIRRL